MSTQQQTIDTRKTEFEAWAARLDAWKPLDSDTKAYKPTRPIARPSTLQTFSDYVDGTGAYANTALEDQGESAWFA